MAADEVEQRLRRFVIRYRLTRGWHALQAALFAFFCAGALLVLADRLLYLGTDLKLLLAALAGLMLTAALAAGLLVPARREYIAYLVDNGVGLKNLIGSGLGATLEGDEVSALIAGRAAAALKMHKPSQIMPLRWHRIGTWALLPAALLLAAFWLKPLDLLGRKAREDRAVAERKEVRNGAMRLQAKLNSVQPAAQSLQSVAAAKIGHDFADLTQKLDANDKQQALMKLGEFENKHRDAFAKQKDFENAASALRNTPDLKGLPPETQEAMRKAMKELKNGNFKNAGEAVRELAKQMEGQNLTAEQKQKLAGEVAKLAEAMKDAGMGTKAKDLMQKMQSEAGLDAGALANAGEALSKEMQEFAGMCDEADALKNMKDGLADAKKEMLGDSFSGFDAKAVEEMMEGEAQLGMGEGMAGLEGKGSGSGEGTGGEGQGKGGEPLENMTETGFKPEKSQAKMNKGAVLNELFVSGVPEKGEAPVEYTDAVRAAREDAAGSLARDQIPREYEQMVKSYFDSLDTKQKE